MLSVGKDAAECIYRMVDARHKTLADAQHGRRARLWLKILLRGQAETNRSDVSPLHSGQFRQLRGHSGASAPRLLGISTELALGTTNDEPT